MNSGPCAKQTFLRFMMGTSSVRLNNSDLMGFLSSDIILPQLVATSRQTFAFARDGALPCSRILYRMNRYTRTPINCIWASVFVASLIGLLSFAGSTAGTAIFSLSIVGQCLAFGIPIAARFLGGQPFRKGPLSFGVFVRDLLVQSAAESAESDARFDRVFP